MFVIFSTVHFFGLLESNLTIFYLIAELKLYMLYINISTDLGV